jgi:hypothetical protein
MAGGRLRQFVQGRQGAVSVGLILLFGVWLRWPTLQNGFFSDDISALAMAEGAYAAPRGKLDLFDFTNGTPEDHALLMRAGSLPWWTAPGLRLAMLRPLSSALMLLDRALFGDQALWCHVHSFLWWLGAMLMAAALLRDLFSPALANIALFLFVLEEGHTLPLGWLANRGALVAMVFCLAGLRAHLRYRRSRDRRAAFVSFACFAIGLLSGEWAFPLLGYVLGYQLFADRAPWRQRMLALWPAAIPGLGFLVCRSALGYGALHSGVYTDPLTEPARFLVMAGQRLPVFFADLVFAIPSHWWGFNTPWREQLLALDVIPPRIWLRLPSWHVWHVALGTLAMACALLALRFGLRSRTERERFELRWLLAGAFIALLPMVSSFPTSRLVLPAALACSAGAAAVLLSAADRLRVVSAAAGGGGWRAYLARGRRGPLLGGLALGFATLYFQVWQAGTKSYYEARWSRANYESVRRMMQDAEIDDTRIAGQRMVILSGIEHTSTIFAPYVRWFFGHPMPRATFTLSAAPYAHDVYRPAANVLELSVLGGTYLSSELEELYRAPRFKLREGQQIDLGALRVDILRLIDQRPQQVRFTFDTSVDDPSLLFLYAAPEGLVRARLPEIGETVRYRRPTFPSLGYNEAMRAARDPNVQCVGPRPPIDECRQGFFFADCGGDGPPVLGCRLTNDCRWFVHGCVAEDYETSSCSAERTCCIPNKKRGPQGSWPFAITSFMTERPFSDQLSESLSAWGRHGWDVASHLTLPVDVEPGLPGLSPYVRCTGVAEDPGPCDAGLLDVSTPRTNSFYFTFRSPRALPTWALSVEVVDDRAGQLLARVCRVPAFDVQPAGVCAPQREAECATAGRLVLSAFPVDPIRLPQLSGRVVAEFADGAHVDAQF